MVVVVVVVVAVVAVVVVVVVVVVVPEVVKGCCQGHLQRKLLEPPVHAQPTVTSPLRCTVALCCPWPGNWSDPLACSNSDFFRLLLKLAAAVHWWAMNLRANPADQLAHQVAAKAS